MKKIIAALAAGMLLLSDTANAQAYPAPDKPIRIIAPFTAGSATDISARIVADILRTELGATAIVDNRAGAQGLIGTEAATKASPDGYTLTISSSSLSSINPGLFKKLPYDPVAGFTHIGRLTTMPVLLLVREGGPYKTLADLLNAGQSGKLNFGYGSPGGQVSGVAFNDLVKIKAQGVSYKSQPPALTDLAGGIVDYVLADLSVATTLLKAGKLRALAVSSPQRLAEWKDVPTFSELGYKGFDLVVWVGLAGPAGMPNEMVQTLNTALTKALAKPEIQAKFHTLGMQTAPNSPQAQNEFVRAQLANWQKRMADARIQPE